VDETHARCGCGGDHYVYRSEEPGFRVGCLRCGTMTVWRRTDTEAWSAWDRAMGHSEISTLRAERDAAEELAAEDAEELITLRARVAELEGERDQAEDRLHSSNLAWQTRYDSACRETGDADLTTQLRRYEESGRAAGKQIEELEGEVERLRGELWHMVGDPHPAATEPEVFCRSCGGTGEEWIGSGGGDGWTGQKCPQCGGEGSHPAATEQPEPTGEGIDVILDLVEHIRQHGIPQGDLAVEVDRVVRARGWDLCESLLARREKAIASDKYHHIPLRTHNGRDPKIDKAQELLDAMIYDWQDVLEQRP
jgi:hypothetical protein